MDELLRLVRGARRFEPARDEARERGCERAAGAVPRARQPRPLEPFHESVSREQAVRDHRRVLVRALQQHEAERRKISLELHDETAQLFAAVKMQLSLLHETSKPELRSPLERVVSLIDAGIHGPLTAGQSHGLERIKANQRHLLGLINDILHYAKIEAGRIELHAEEFPVHALVGEVVALVEPQIAAAGLEYHSTSHGAVNALGDPDKVRQVLLNLLANAIKFTPPSGRIEICCRREGEWVHVRVRDTGRGIPEEMTQKIFDPFVQVRDPLGRDSSRLGVGLGLAISRDLARAMGGDLTVRSAPGAGSTFTLRLPLVTAPDA
jgi:signal transduction histidine kinase